MGIFNFFLRKPNVEGSKAECVRETGMLQSILGLQFIVFETKGCLTPQLREYIAEYAQTTHSRDTISILYEAGKRGPQRQLQNISTVSGAILLFEVDFPNWSWIIRSSSDGSSSILKSELGYDQEWISLLSTNPGQTTN